MKKILKIIGACVLILIAAVFIVGNMGKVLVSIKQKEYSQSLEGMVAEINRHLPHKGFNGFDYFVANRLILEGDKVVWDATLDTTFFYPLRESMLPESVNGGILASGDRSMAIDLDTILTNEVLKESQLENVLYYNLFARSNKPNKFYEEIMNRQYSQVWRIHSPFSDKKSEFTITSAEQKEIEEFCNGNPDVAIRKFLSEYVRLRNRLLEIASKNADCQMLMSDNGSALVFHCIFNKTFSKNGNKPISNIREQYEVVFEGLKDDAQTLPIFYDLKGICSKTHRDFIFRYEDWNKTDSVDFVMY